MNAIPHPLRAWREKQGISLRDMAGRLTGPDGRPLLSHVSLGRIERGLQPPSIDVMAAADRVTGGEVAYEQMAKAYLALQGGDYR